jgi:outer membrane protein
MNKEHSMNKQNGQRWWAIAALMSASIAYAEEEPPPLWEVGAGVAVTSFPDYRGSDEGHTYILPIPYLVYQGKYFKVDRQGARGNLARSDNFQLDVSASIGPPASSEENSARSGMPDLDATLELGPSLRWRLYQGGDGKGSLTAHFPIRTVVVTDFSYVDNIGWFFSPQLSYDSVILGGWKFGVSAGPVYAAQRFHEYYYEVRPQFATPTRPAYDVRGGYSGFRTTLTTSRRFDRWWVGAFVRYDNLSGAVFEDSPLMRTDHSVVAGVALSRIFYSSPKPAKDTDDIAAP